MSACFSLAAAFALVSIAAADGQSAGVSARGAKLVRHQVSHASHRVRSPGERCPLPRSSDNHRRGKAGLRARLSAHSVSHSIHCRRSPPAGAAPPNATPNGPPSASPTTPLDNAAPPPAVATQGYHEVFADDFDTLDRSVWDSHIWYDETPHANWTAFQEVDANGILHLRTSRAFTYGNCSANCYPINTITTQSAGRTFKYGYFEARMKWSAGNGAWPGFWLYSYQHALDTNQCATQAGEIDVMEGQGSEPNVFYGTVHSNTNGCSPADDQNGNNYQPVDADLTTGFHTYGALWTPTSIAWYLDDKLVMSAPTYPTDDQPMFILLQMWSGGWTKDPDSSTPDVIETQVDWVRVWQQ